MDGEVLIPGAKLQIYSSIISFNNMIEHFLEKD
jgi:hypothetical protein